MVKKLPLSIQDGRQKSKMAATKFSYFNKRSKIGTNDCLLPYIEYRIIKYPL